MPSVYCERAIEDAGRCGNAILKFISPNDVGITGSHQCGFYLPKSVWQMYTPFAPNEGRLDKHDVEILWPDGRATKSVVTWYGQGTRSEYRLTRFGRDFPWLTNDNVGNLLVLIPKTLSEFVAYVLETEEDIEELQAALGIVPFERWGVFREGVAEIISEDECIDREIRQFAQPLTEFPTGEVFSGAARDVLQRCIAGGLDSINSDQYILRGVDTEYQLFRMVERQICQPEITRLFKDIDDFLKTAATIMNRRKSRAGRSLENHVDFILGRSQIPHKMQPAIDGKPDIVIPDETAYFDDNYPVDKLFIVGVKTTCKDRWRQVLNEGRRVKRKYLLTVQQGISSNQLAEMKSAGLTLIVPKRLQRGYPPDHRRDLLTVEGFIAKLGRKLSVR